MNRFLGSLKLRALTLTELRSERATCQLWELLEPFTFENGAAVITVPAGFITDFASIPGFAKWYVDDDSPEILGAAVVHDFVYSRRGLMDGIGLTRRDADTLLREAMLASGASRAKAWIVYHSVRLGGASHWNN